MTDLLRGHAPGPQHGAKRRFARNLVFSLTLTGGLGPLRGQAAPCAPGSVYTWVCAARYSISRGPDCTRFLFQSTPIPAPVRAAVPGTRPSFPCSAPVRI